MELRNLYPEKGDFKRNGKIQISSGMGKLGKFIIHLRYEKNKLLEEDMEVTMLKVVKT